MHAPESVNRWQEVFYHYSEGVEAGSRERREYYRVPAGPRKTEMIKNGGARYSFSKELISVLIFC